MFRLRTNSDLANTTVSSLEASPSPTASGQASSDTSRDSQPNVGAIAGATAAGTIALLAIGVLLFVFLRRRRRLMKRYEPDHSDRLKPNRRSQGQGGREGMNFASSVASLPYEESIASSHPYPHTPRSRYHESSEGHSREPSPSDSDVPLMGISPSHQDPFSRGQQPRIVQVGGETRLEGPDNSMARLARKEIAEREAELSRRVREVEDALATKRSTDAPPGAETSSSADRPGPSQLGPGSTPPTSSILPPHQGTSEAVLRDQLNELRAEMERMKILQQQMTLELRDAIEPPPGYQTA